MAKNSIRDYSATNSSNTDIQSIDIAEGCSPAGINNAIREVMADLKDVSTGTVALESPAADSLTVTGDLTVDTSTLKVDSTNNRVGIANASPSVELDVTGAAKVSGDLTVDSNTLYVDSTNNRVGISDGTPDAKLDVTSTSGTALDIGRFEAAVGGYTGTSLVAGNTLGPDSAYNLFKCISDSDGDGGGPYTEFVVRGDGKVGIRQSSPATPLHIDGLPGTTTLRLDAGGTLAGARRNWGISAEKYAAGALTIEYGSTEGAAPSNNAMTIDSGGNVLVGYTSSNGAYKLQVNSQIFATSATIATSDGNYKENVTPLDGVLSLVSQLNPVQFDWKEHPVHEFDRNQPTIGFIAQEVKKILAEQPYLNSIVKSNECVLEPEETDDEGNVIKEAVTEPFLGIAEGNMVALLTAAIKEQQATITALEARITALENA